MADQDPQAQPAPNPQPPKAAAPAADNKPKSDVDPNAIPQVNLREARLRESALVHEAGRFVAVINGPEEDPFKGIDPAFLY